MRKLTPAYGDILIWDDIGQSDYSSILLQATYQRNKMRFNLAYTLGWYQGDFDTAGLPTYTYDFLFNRQRTTGDERHRVTLSDIIPLPFGFNFSSVATIASPRPFLTTDGRDINLDNVLTDDYPGGTVSTTGIRTTMPANSWNNWYRTVDVRLTRPLFTRNKTKVSLSAEAFNVFNFNNNLVRRHAVQRQRHGGGDVRQADRCVRRPYGSARHALRLLIARDGNREGPRKRGPSLFWGMASGLLVSDL